MLRDRFPPRIRAYVRVLRYGARTAGALFGRYPRQCSVCDFNGKFFAYGNPLFLGVTVDALCPNCLSLERHRLLALCDKELNLFANKDILHFAPEVGMDVYIKRRSPNRYITCDISDPMADLAINIEEIDLPDASFDVVVCSHVLEHVQDKLAIPELSRIVRPGGVVIVMVPLIEGWQKSFEDVDKTKTTSDRILYFNQHDHIRMFGSDLRERLSSRGFTVEEFTAVEPFVSRYGLMRGEKVFLARKS